MRKFIYIGDEPSVFAFGLTFPRGAFVEVTDAHALKKLANHPHFRSAPDDGYVEVQPGFIDGLPREAPEIGAALTPEAQATTEGASAVDPDAAPHSLEAQFSTDTPNALLGQPKKKGRRK